MKHSGAKKTPHKGSNQSSSRGNLRLIEGQGGQKPSEPSLRIMLMFLAFAAIAFTIMIYFSKNPQTQVAYPEQLLQRLPEIYSQQGVEKFLENKQILKDWVTEALRHPEREAQWNFARNVSVYLFPEVLPGEDFERAVALNQWYPIELAIEKANKDPESRFRFEDLRADVWNYENPDREHPQLTTYASQVIRIYDALTAP